MTLQRRRRHRRHRRPPRRAGASPSLPNAWAPTINGNLRYALRPGSGNAQSARVGIDTVNLIEDINVAGMVAAKARYERFSVMTDFIYLDMGNAGSRVDSADLLQIGRNPVSTRLDAGTDSSAQGTLWTLAGGYTLAQGDWGNVDGFAGFRLFAFSANTDL